ncbi:MAG TPA: hypothetical protein VL309_08570 [Vicinamibacterales bacterium]|nr:hypothetical protein [Vicinamibacterales bacterium]
MRSAIRSALLAMLVAAATIALPAALLAQPTAQVRVTRDRATIWRRDARIPATTVRAGTVLDAVARQGEWYVVVIPNSPIANDLGLISVTVVQLVPGSPVPPERAPATPRSTAPGAQRRPLPPARAVQYFAFGEFGYGRWTAHKTFDAVAGSAFFPMFGGGGEVRLRSGLFAGGSVDYFQKAGERVFVDDTGTVFRLGIKDEIRVVPIEGRIGYRQQLRKYAWYVAGGAGVTLYHEESDFATGVENVSDHFPSYHGLAGVEFGTGVLRTAFEVEFTSVPRAFGTTGAAGAFGERDLGGIQARIKVLGGK